jgi:3',5'-cyclic AMP phosphodiesterase CpdA
MTNRNRRTTRRAIMHPRFRLQSAAQDCLPLPVTRKIRLFHVSDLHFGQEDRAALDWFAGEVAAHRPDATGDLTMRGRVREFAAAAEWLGGLGAPVSIEAGNHDMPYYWDPLRRLMRPYQRFQAMRREVHSDLAVDGVALVSLKTVSRAQWRLNWSKGMVRPLALGAAVAGIDAADARGLRLVACHHPLLDSGTRSTGSTRGGKRALAQLARAGADAVLSGHVHDAFDLQVETEGGPIRVIGAGTLSERLRATRPSYNRLEWSPGAGLVVKPQAMD